MIRLICARCRYECQTELQRVICPRCASIVETPVEAPDIPEPLELAQNEIFASAGSETDSLLELSQSPKVEPLGDLLDDVIDVPESSQNGLSYNPAFAEPDAQGDEILLEEDEAEVTTRLAPADDSIPLSGPRIIRLSEPKTPPANPEPMYFVPKRLPFFQGKSWRGPAAVAALALAGLGLYSLQGRSSPTHPVTSASSAANVAKKTTPAPALSKTPAAQPTVITAASPSPAPVRTTKTTDDMLKAEKKPAAESRKNDRAGDTVAKQGDGKLTVQVASFPSEQEARERVSYLKSIGVQAQIVRADLGTRGIYYRVMTGRFMKPDEARKYGQELLSKGKVQEFVVARL